MGLKPLFDVGLEVADSTGDAVPFRAGFAVSPCVKGGWFAADYFSGFVGRVGVPCDVHVSNSFAIV